MCVFQTGRNGSDVFSCFQPKQVKTVPTVSTCYACKAGCWNGFKRVLTCCGLKHCWSCCWDFALSSSWLSCGTIKTRGKLSLEKKYGWCQKFFFPFFFKYHVFSSKKGFGVVSRMSKPRFKKKHFYWATWFGDGVDHKAEILSRAGFQRGNIQRRNPFYHIV